MSEKADQQELTPDFLGFLACMVATGAIGFACVGWDLSFVDGMAVTLTAVAAMLACAAVIVAAARHVSS